MVIVGVTFGYHMIDTFHFRLRENTVQPPSAQSAPAGAPAAPPWQDTGDGAPVQSDAARSREEMSMLLIGFALGLSIGFIFLVYIVLAIAGWLG